LQKTISEDADADSPRKAAKSDEALSAELSETRSGSPVEEKPQEDEPDEADKDSDDEEEEAEEEPEKEEPVKNRSHKKKVPATKKGGKKGGKLPGKKHSARDGLKKPLAVEVAAM
jgi:hypothetical protein